MLRKEEMHRGHHEDKQSRGDSRQREKLAIRPCSAMQPGHLESVSRVWFDTASWARQVLGGPPALNQGLNAPGPMKAPGTGLRHGPRFAG